MHSGQHSQKLISTWSDISCPHLNRPSLGSAMYIKNRVTANSSQAGVCRLPALSSESFLLCVSLNMFTRFIWKKAGWKSSWERNMHHFPSAWATGTLQVGLTEKVFPKYTFKGSGPRRKVFPTHGVGCVCVRGVRMGGCPRAALGTGKYGEERQESGQSSRNNVSRAGFFLFHLHPSQVLLLGKCLCFGQRYNGGSFLAMTLPGASLDPRVPAKG